MKVRISSPLKLALFLLCMLAVFFVEPTIPKKPGFDGVDITYRVVAPPFELFEVEKIKPTQERLLNASCGFIRVHWGDNISDIHELSLAIQNKENLIFIVDSSELPAETKQKFDQKNALLAYARSTGALTGNFIYLLRDRVRYEEVEHVVAHEIGHNLGLSDNNEPQSLMFSFISDANGSDSISLQAIDREEFCKKHGCEAQDLNCQANFP